MSVVMATGFEAKTLLEPMSESQQHMIEVIGQAFASNQWKWPVFDYLEGTLELDGIDAWTELESLPRHPGTGYAAAWWERIGGAKPRPEAAVGLTILGLSRAEVRQPVIPGMVPTFFALMKVLAEWRRQRPLAVAEPRNLRISSDEVVSELAKRGISDSLLSPMLLKGMLDHEPGGWLGGGSTSQSGDWEHDVAREVYRFEQIETIEAYVEETVAMFRQPAPPEVMAAPSPLGLVAAIDYLDTVWRLAPDHSDHLFRLQSAQRIALLLYPANTADEFDSRLSGIGELLRSMKPPAHTARSRRNRDKPLAPLETHLKSLLPNSHPRIERAIKTLHNVIDVRDGAQHTAAGKKGAAALAALGVGYPPSDWRSAWDVVMARTIESLEALREELATLAP